MKTGIIRNLFLLPVLIAGLGVILVGRSTAQTFTVLHSFAGGDGAFPYAGLILSGNTLYGTAALGGGSDGGTVFAVNTDGTGFTTLHSFAGPDDGANPEAGLILSGNTLYGTAAGGGSSGNGTVFKVNTDGTGFTNLYSFTGGNDGADPTAGFLKLTADDTDDTDAEGCRTSFDIFAFTQRVNTLFEGIFFLSALSAESVVSAAFFTVLRCRVAKGLLL